MDETSLRPETPSRGRQLTQGLAQQLVQRLAEQYASLAPVQAVCLSGSRTGLFPDERSDVDLYVYVTEAIPLGARATVAAGAERAEIGNQTWEPGDEWIDSDTGISVDVMFRHVRWIEEQLDRVLVQHQASVGYSTCFWYNVLHSEPLFDSFAGLGKAGGGPEEAAAPGWFARLQQRARVPYPPELQHAILAKNYPLLRQNQSSYLHQIELAIARQDPVSVNHRVTALLASYFDVVFALNAQPHPGEKRLLSYMGQLCALRPPNLSADLESLFRALPELGDRIPAAIHRLVDGLDGVCRQLKG